MPLGFKLIVPSVLALYLAAACTPDLDSLSANYSAHSSGGAGGTDVESPEGGSDNGSGGKGTSSGGNDTSSGGSPSTDPCMNNEKDSKESDVDCGGTSKCDRCAANFKCTANNDCESLSCKNGVCTSASCKDKIKNQDETGVDCGGHCPPCESGLGCELNEDCEGYFCFDNGKSKVCADHCVSGTKESDETDKDCGGGTCDPCADDKGCSEAGDCTSGICSNKHCQKATCSDGAQNQDESATDCGGVCASTKPCGIGVHCNSEADCESWICSGASKCIADTVVVGANDIIDDVEDGDFSAAPLGGRAGNWYVYGDGTGTFGFDVAAINRGASQRGVHTKGKDFSKWGSGMGVDMLSAKAPYSAGTYSGVTFWARAAATLPVLIVFPDVDTDPGGKLCTTCDHHYNKAVQVTTGWQRFTVNFADLNLEAGTVPEPTGFKSDGLISVQFRMAPGQTYELYVDDLAFVKTN